MSTAQNTPTSAAPVPAAPKRFLSPYERATFEKDAKGLRRIMQDEKSTDTARQLAAQALRRTEDNVAANTAPELGPADRDKMAKRVLALEEKLRDGLLSNEEMRRNPHGAVTANVAYEKRNKHLITRWRNGLRALNADMPAHALSDLTNLERLRPRTSTMSMADCQIPQVRAFSFPPNDPQYSANYDAIDWDMGARTQAPKADPHGELMAQFEGDMDEAAATVARAAEAGDFEVPRKPTSPVPVPPVPAKPQHPNQQRR